MTPGAPERLREIPKPGGRRAHPKAIQIKEDYMARAQRNVKRRPRPIYTRRKNCRFCSGNLPRIDYKDVDTLRQFITARGKMLSRRITGNCAKHQRQVSQEIKKARYLALLPYVGE